MLVDRPDFPEFLEKDILRRLLKSFLKDNSPALQQKTKEVTLIHKMNPHLKQFRSLIAEKNLTIPPVVAGYYPLPHEVDALPLLEALNAEGYTCAIPAITEIDKALTFREWKPSDVLNEERYFIPQPGPEAAVVSPSFLFVPVLAFDERGYRLGYGGGFFDRTLHLLHETYGEKLVAIGLAFDEQRVARVPVEEHDQQLTYIVTPTSYYGPFHD